MARRHRRRRYGDPVISMPSFGSLKALNPIGGSVAAKNVAIGAGIGLVGGAAVKYALAKFWPTRPAILIEYEAPIVAIAAGVAAGAFVAKKSPDVGRAYVLGSAIVGLAPVVMAQLKSSFPSVFSGLMVRSPQFAGMLRPAPIRNVRSISPVRRAVGF